MKMASRANKRNCQIQRFIGSKAIPYIISSALWLKNTAASLSLEIAEKLLKKNLSNDDSQKSLVQEYLKESKFN